MFLLISDSPLSEKKEVSTARHEETAMQKSALFAMPLKAGKLNEYKAFVREAQTARGKEYSDMLKRYDLKNVKVWHHKFGDRDYILVLHDIGENALKLLEGWSASTHPFDNWFNKHLLNCYDISSLETAPKQPEFMFALKSS